MSRKLTCYPITHGEIRKLIHPRLKTEIDNQTTVRYLRFICPVKIDHLELPRSVYGRWTPAVPTHPAHLLISIADPRTKRWQLVKEVDLPYDPRTAGEGLHQSMPVEEQEAHFAAIMKDPPYRIDLGGLETNLLRVECDREHPVWPNHGECNGSPYSVPFGILDPLEVYGEGEPPYRQGFVYQKGLQQLECHPVPPSGMQARQTPTGIYYEGPHFSIGFSLKRPQLVHLGWDALGQDQAARNRLRTDLTMGIGTQVCGLSGPLLKTVHQDFGAHTWSGEVSVHENMVEYRNLHPGIAGLSIDAMFTIEPDGIIVDLKQTVTAEIPVLEAETWRFAWDLRRGITATSTAPDLLPGRNGRVGLPLAWASDGAGCLVCQPDEGSNQTWIAQVESYRSAYTNTCGLCPVNGITGGGPDGLLLLQPGVFSTRVRLQVDAFRPRQVQPGENAGIGLRRHWGSVFSCFRPEHRGFSNNAASVNCNLSQAVPIDIIGSTGKLACGLDPADLSRFTLKRALLDGGGYGYWRNLYLDSDPALLIATGRLHQTSPDHAWLSSVEPGLREVTGRVLGNRDENGLVVCRDLSGNSGSYRWSCNGMDVVGFGHLDAYVNTNSYRGLRNAAALFADLGDADFAGQCREAAAAIKNVFSATFLNPATGWVAGWRSRDGELHDSGFIFVNAPAIAYGLLDEKDARRALVNLEAAREEVGANEGYFGLPANLYPIPAGDHMMPIILGSPQPTFENYTDGGFNGNFAGFYLRALSMYGLKGAATHLADELEQGFAAGYHNGGIGEGTEFRTWDGLQTGYEGTLIGNFVAVYSLAIEHGWIRPTDPEWWGAQGK